MRGVRSSHFGSRLSVIANDLRQTLSGVAAHLAIDPKDKTLGNINMVNALRSHLADFMRPFHDVTTRRLQRYLDWFRYRSDQT